jgi:hypothetical protein
MILDWGVTTYLDVQEKVFSGLKNRFPPLPPIGEKNSKNKFKTFLELSSKVTYSKF